MHKSKQVSYEFVGKCSQELKNWHFISVEATVVNWSYPVKNMWRPIFDQYINNLLWGTDFFQSSNFINFTCPYTYLIKLSYLNMCYKFWEKMHKSSQNWSGCGTPLMHMHLWPWIYLIQKYFIDSNKDASLVYFDCPLIKILDLRGHNWVHYAKRVLVDSYLEFKPRYLKNL